MSDFGIINNIMKGVKMLSIKIYRNNKLIHKELHPEVRNDNIIEK